jgi:hypothetical protein
MTDTKKSVIFDLEKKLWEINASIESTLWERQRVLTDAREKIAEAMNTEKLFGLTIFELADFMRYHNWEGLRSDIVEKTVSAVRKVFFDDNDERFRNLFFVFADFDRIARIEAYYRSREKTSPAFNDVDNVMDAPKLTKFFFTTKRREFIILSVPTVCDRNDVPFLQNVEEAIFDFGFKVETLSGNSRHNLHPVLKTVFKSRHASEVRSFLNRFVGENGLDMKEVEKGEKKRKKEQDESEYVYLVPKMISNYGTVCRTEMRRSSSKKLLMSSIIDTSLI